jgi:hypothetical protein
LSSSQQADSAMPVIRSEIDLVLRAQSVAGTE